MNESEKRFEMIDGVIHYREYKFEMIKDAELTQEDYDKKKLDTINELIAIRDEIDVLSDQEKDLERDLMLFNKFEQVNTAVEEEKEEEEDEIEVIEEDNQDNQEQD